jgi:transposase
MHERIKFIASLEEDDASFAEMYRRFGVGRKTGYQWLERYENREPLGSRCV